jgi:calmodulin
VKGAAVTENRYRALFSLMDTDGDGLIDVSEFKDLLDRLGGESVTEETASRMFSEIDGDGDGRVNLGELDDYLADVPD